MASRTAYADDFYLWSQEQAALLRDLPRAASDLPNALDIENIAEEIESVGRSELGKVESYLIQIMIHLLKLASLGDDAEPASHWRREIFNFQAIWPSHYVPSMRQNIDLATIWRRSTRTAERTLASFGDRLLPLPERSPLDLDDLLGESIEIDALVLKIRSASVALG
jgi:hypothetical protein